MWLFFFFVWRDSCVIFLLQFKVILLGRTSQKQIQTIHQNMILEMNMMTNSLMMTTMTILGCTQLLQFPKVEVI